MKNCLILVSNLARGANVKMWEGGGEGGKVEKGIWNFNLSYSTFTHMLEASMDCAGCDQKRELNMTIGRTISVL